MGRASERSSRSGLTVTSSGLRLLRVEESPSFPSTRLSRTHCSFDILVHPNDSKKLRPRRCRISTLIISISEISLLFSLLTETFSRRLSMSDRGSCWCRSTRNVGWLSPSPRLPLRLRFGRRNGLSSRLHRRFQSFSCSSALWNPMCNLNRNSTSTVSTITTTPQQRHGHVLCPWKSTTSRKAEADEITA
jgi:hypothetical protein